MNQYYTVQSWMVNELGLRSIERDCFAIIFGFCQDGISDFHAGLKYIMQVTGYSRNAVCRALQNLTDQNYIIKQERKEGNFKYCSYQINWNTIHQGEQNPIHQEELPIHPACMDPIHQGCTRNKEIRKKENKKILSKDKIQTEPFLGSINRDKIPKENLYDKCVNYIDSFTQDPGIRSSLVKYLKSLLEMSKQDNRTLYYNMFVARINKLNEFDQKDWPQIIKATLDNSWKNFYGLENGNASKTFNDNAISESYTEQELQELKRVEEERKANGLQTKF